MRTTRRPSESMSTYVQHLCLCSLFVLAVLSLSPGVHAQSTEAGTSVHSASRIGDSETWTDQGEFYRVDGRKIRLRRSQEKLAVRHRINRGGAVRKTLKERQWVRRPFSVDRALPKQQMLVVRLPHLTSPAEFDGTMEQIQQAPDVKQVTPVYINEETGLEMICTDEFIVKLSPDATLRQLEKLNDEMGVTLVRPLRGTTDQFILSMEVLGSESLLDLCEIYRDDPIIVWASPNFLSQMVPDSLGSNPESSSGLWHLDMINASGAWKHTMGSPDIVVAVIDNGVDVDHVDLKDKFPSPGTDLNNNGYYNDTYGWDFYDNDNDPRPSDPNDNHGTRVAGVIAAGGAGGALGCANNCTLMALRVAEGEPGRYLDSDMAEAILYAAGFHKNQIGRWHGADVINISMHFDKRDVVENALEKAAKDGRLGKGCPIFCSSSNNPNGWRPRLIHFPKGDYGSVTIRWEYEKDSSGSEGQDAVWLDQVTFPDGTEESFEQNVRPAGWTSGGHSKWYSVQNDVGGNHALTGWDGQKSRAVRSGSIGDNGRSYLEVKKTFNLSQEGALTFWTRISCDSGDHLRLLINGQEFSPIYGFGKNDDNLASVAFPASHADTIAVGASTNFDFRAAYSHYGPGLDFVAPSSGGSESIYTTDRTDIGFRINGIEGDYSPNFGGTSAAPPLAASVGALMLSRNPELTAAQVRSMMQQTCDKPESDSVPYANGWNKYYGYGRINAAKAVAEAGTAAGSLKVTIDPAGARSAGARWRRVGTSTWRRSGDTEQNVPTGNHTVEFRLIAGWLMPSKRTVSISAGQTKMISATYTKFTPPPLLGSLKVTINPISARNAGARWRRKGTTTWHTSGHTEKNLLWGSHTLEFKSIDGWIRPWNSVVSIRAGETTSASATYIKSYTPPTFTGSLTVTINPADARSAGAKWRRKGTTTWRASGYEENNLFAGSYTVEFKSTTGTGWIRPADKTVFVSTGKTTFTSVTYIRLYTPPSLTGSLTVTINPAAVRNAGAKWRRKGTTIWRTSGYTETGVPAGNHTVEFKSVSGWFIPTRTVSVAAGKKTSIICTYGQINFLTGSLTVTINPATVRNAGAKWRRKGTTTWRTSGYIETGVPAGSHTIEFSSVSGWYIPNRTVSITTGKMTSIICTYGQIIRVDPPISTGSLTVTINPEKARNAGAKWRRKGTSIWRTSGYTETNVPAGSHTVEFSFIGGWLKPLDREVSISAGQTTWTTGKYYEITWGF